MDTQAFQSRTYTPNVEEINPQSLAEKEAKEVEKQERLRKIQIATTKLQQMINVLHGAEDEGIQPIV